MYNTHTHHWSKSQWAWRTFYCASSTIMTDWLSNSHDNSKCPTSHIHPFTHIHTILPHTVHCGASRPPEPQPWYMNQRQKEWTEAYYIRCLLISVTSSYIHIRKSAFLQFQVYLTISINTCCCHPLSDWQCLRCMGGEEHWSLIYSLIYWSVCSGFGVGREQSPLCFGHLVTWPPTMCLKPPILQWSIQN